MLYTLKILYLILRNDSPSLDQHDQVPNKIFRHHIGFEEKHRKLSLQGPICTYFLLISSLIPDHNH